MKNKSITTTIDKVRLNNVNRPDLVTREGDLTKIGMEVFAAVMVANMEAAIYNGKGNK